MTANCVSKFLLDLFELQEMVCLTKHGAALSLCLTSQGLLESISEINSHKIWQEVSEL